jgi:hypothetical protein
MGSGECVHDLNNLLAKYKMGFAVAEFCGWKENILNITLKAERELRMYVNKSRNYGF